MGQACAIRVAMSHNVAASADPPGWTLHLALVRGSSLGPHEPEALPRVCEAGASRSFRPRVDPGTEQIHNQEGFPRYSKLATARPVEQRIARVPSSLARAAGFLQAHIAPPRRAAAPGDDGRVAGGDGDAEAFASLVIGDDFGQSGGNAQALKLRQDDEPRDALRPFPAERGEDGTEGDGL